MPVRRSIGPQVGVPDADERVMRLDDLEDVVPPTDDGDPEVIPEPPPDPLTG